MPVQKVRSANRAKTSRRQSQAALLLTLLCFSMLSWSLVFQPHPSKSQCIVLNMIFALAAGSAAVLWGGLANVDLSGSIAPGLRIVASFASGIAVFVFCILFPLFPIHRLRQSTLAFYPATITKICGQLAQREMVVSNACSVAGAVAPQGLRQKVLLLFRASHSMPWQFLDTALPRIDEWSVSPHVFPLEHSSDAGAPELLAVSVDVDDIEDASDLTAKFNAIRDTDLAGKFVAVPIRVRQLELKIDRVCGRELSGTTVEVRPVCDIEGSSSDLPAGVQVCVEVTRSASGEPNEADQPNCSTASGRRWTVASLPLRLPGAAGPTSVTLRAAISYEADSENPAPSLPPLAVSQTAHAQVPAPSLAVTKVSVNHGFEAFGTSNGLLPDEQIAVLVQPIGSQIVAGCVIYTQMHDGERWSAADRHDARIPPAKSYRIATFIGSASGQESFHSMPSGFIAIGESRRVETSAY
jgi:hypothetical protein